MREAGFNVRLLSAGPFVRRRHPRREGSLFLLAAARSVPVVITAALTRARYPGSMLAEQLEGVAGS